ncbi:MAG TPA: 2,3,4,5-tetrahydropyridine-2,6-dicarboxylate N-succinyltransferase [Candidatus Baltobacteraceae bacterium]|jgi:2,3,4,5-tetrahydropyridine-2-carboxylate N-succinyltransferase|nr:2,3,4,5-tetrahydropyridine-2,6-dicarboxylate N-succinyltransferase [Candidatus Baltobacteraceae bacterium]
MNVEILRTRIEALGKESDLRRSGLDSEAIGETIAGLDEGRLRVCELLNGVWITHVWIKQAILLYFRLMGSVSIGTSETLGDDAILLRGLPPSYYDKLPTKRNFERLGARCVPPGTARYGSFLGRGAILMPGYINIGAYVDERTMVDTWATVGSCAQIGKDVHLSGGVGIGGVLEPPQAQPVIIEDGAFIGSRAIVVEGVHIGREAVLGAGVVLTSSTPIVDVRGEAPMITRGKVEARSVVIPGTMPKRFAAGEFGVPCALVIGERTESTDRKTSLESVLREYAVAV